MPSLAAWFAHWLGSPPTQSSAPAEPPLARASVEYPRPDPGLPAIAVAELIAPHSDCLRRLRDAYGAEQAVFDRDIGSVVERYAHYVHLLPAAPDGPYGQAGGLFRAGLDIGFYALQATDAAIFSGRQTITARAALEPRWRYATFLAGLCSELHRTLNHLRVHNAEGLTWPAYRQPLALWLQATRSRRYHVRWTPNSAPVRALGIVAMTHVVGPEIMQHLSLGNSVVVPHLVAAMSRTLLPGEANTLDHLVRRAGALVLERAARPDVASAAACLPPLPQSPSDAGEPACAATVVDPEFTPSPSPSPPLAARAPPARRAALALIAPARLHPAVREALRQIIAGLDSCTLPPPACVVANGVFVPLRELARRQVDPALAVRTLRAAHMLACDPSDPQSPTCLRQVDEEAVLGVVLAPACVSGLDTRVGANGR